MTEWETSKLHDWVAANDIELGRGNIISKDDINAFPGPYPIYSSSAHNNGKFGEYAKFMFDEELITWSVDGGGNLFYRPKHRFSVTNVCGYMRIKTADLHAPFIYYCLAEQHKHQTFDYTTKAHPSVIRKLYWLPKLDVQVQRKIARILQTIDLAIEKTEALIEKHQQIKAGLMHDLFTRGIGADGKLRPPREQAPELYQQTPLGWLPKDWSIVQLQNTCKVIDSLHKTPNFKDDGYAMVRVTDIKPGELLLESCVMVSQAVFAEFSENHKPKFGDIVMSRVGSYGISSYVSDDVPFCIGQNTVVITGHKRSRFLYEYLQTSIVRKLFELQLVGSSQKTLSLKAIREVYVPDISIQEMEWISEKLHAASEFIMHLDEELSKLVQQKSGLMHDLLTGKVQVNVDQTEAAHV